MNTTISRRSFLKGSLAVSRSNHCGFCQPSWIPGCSMPPQREEAVEKFQPQRVAEITPDNKVNIFIGNSEMGQGVHTAHSMIIADELEADWKQVRIQPGRSA